MASKISLNLGASWLDHAVKLIAGLVLMPFVLTTLGEFRYGTWLFINSIAGYSGLLYLGFGQTSCRYFAASYARGDREKLNKVLNVVLAVYVVMAAIGLLIALALAVTAHLWNDWGTQSITEIRWVVVLLGINFAVGLIGSTFGALLAGIQRFDIERGICIASGLIRIGLTFALLESDWGLITLASIFLFLTCLEVIGHTLCAWKLVDGLAVGVKYCDIETFKECATFSFYAFADTIAYQVLMVTDTVVIGFMLGVEAIVPYYLALRMCQFMQRPIQHIGRVLMPRAGELNEQGKYKELEHVLAQGVGISFLLTASFYIGSHFFGADLLQTWVHKEYLESPPLLLVLLLAFVVATPIEIVRNILFGMGHVRLPALLQLAAVVINVVLSIALIGPLGLVGVAIGTFIPMVLLELVVLMPYALRVLKTNSVRLIRLGLVPQLLPLLFLYAYCVAVANQWPQLTNWAELVAVAAGGGLALGLGRIVFSQLESLAILNRFMATELPASLNTNIE